VASKGHSSGFYSTPRAPPPRPPVQHNIVAGMTKADVEALLEGVCPVIREFVDAEIAKLRDHFKSEIACLVKIAQEATATAVHQHKIIGELQSRITVLEHRCMRFEGTFSRAIEYQRGAVAVHNGSLWYAIMDTLNQPPPCDSWLLVSKGGSAQSSANLHAIEAKPAPAARRGHEINLEGRVGRG
jgi:hypothetical protein